MKVCLECRKKMGDALKVCPYCQGEPVPEGDPRLEAPAEPQEPAAEPTAEVKADANVVGETPAEKMTPEQKKAALMAAMMTPPKKEKEGMPKAVGCMLYAFFMLMMGIFAKYFYDWLYLGR